MAPFAPLIKDRISTRYEPHVGLDIHRLLVCPDPGRRLSRSYRTVEALGQGSFGSVYRAEHVPTREDRAIKVIRKPTDEKHIKRVLTEVQLLIQLDHPNIMKFHEYFEDPAHVYLVTELCCGGDLGELDVSIDDPEEIKLLFRDVVSAISYCHSEGVAHRDLKFDNVLLTQPDSGKLRRVAKVIDFGLSAIRQAGETGEWMDDQVGTIYYIAPEVLLGTRCTNKYGFSCDVWSIGIMLYIIYTNQHPFVNAGQGQDVIMEAIKRAVLRRSPLAEAAVDPEARDLIVRLLQKDPQKRLSAREALEHPWLRRPALRPSLEGSPTGPTTELSGRTPDISMTHMQSLLNRVHSFQDFTRFEKAILTLVAYKAKAREVKDLRAAFTSLDRARAGWLSREDFQAALNQRGLRLPPEELAYLLTVLDPHGDGKIRYTEWLAATIKPSALTSEKAMQEVFNFFDIHGLGKVSCADLQEVLGEDVAGCFGCPCDENKAELDLDDFRRLITEEGVKMECLRRRMSRKIRWSVILGDVPDASPRLEGVARSLVA